MGIVTCAEIKKTCGLIIFVTACCFENFLVAAPIYGYSSLLEIFKTLKLYHHLCGTADSSAFQEQNYQTSCNKQDLSLNSIFIFGIFFHFGLKFPIGVCVDRFGPQLCQYAGW